MTKETEDPNKREESKDRIAVPDGQPATGPDDGKTQLSAASSAAPKDAAPAPPSEEAARDATVLMSSADTAALSAESQRKSAETGTQQRPTREAAEPVDLDATQILSAQNSPTPEATAADATLIERLSEKASTPQHNDPTVFSAGAEAAQQQRPEPLDSDATRVLPAAGASTLERSTTDATLIDSLPDDAASAPSAADQTLVVNTGAATEVVTDEPAVSMTDPTLLDSAATEVIADPGEAGGTIFDGSSSLSSFTGSSTASTLVPPPRGGINVRTGDTLDRRFILEKELGRGGMSKVFRARDSVKERARDRDTHVAVKVLTGDFGAHPDSWIALQREVSKVQKLAHPRIVTIHDFTIDADSGVPYAQMEVLKGESLEDLIARHPHGIKDYAQFEAIIQGIAEGLEYAHKRSIVHADLKPSNVFITEEGEAKILDFGISRFVHGDAGDFFEESGLTALTPRYASAEMCEGSPALPVDDIYALGIIALELATGEHPFIGPDFADIRTARDARDAGIKAKRPALIRSNRQWRAIAASLEYARDDRPEDGAAFIHRFKRRSKVAILSVAASLLLVGAMGIWTVFFQVPQPEIPFEELPAETQAQVESALAAAAEAMRFRDINGALPAYEEAFELHPFNRDVMDGLDEILDIFFAQPTPTNAAERQERLEQVEILMGYGPLSDSRKLRRYQRKLQGSG